MVRLYRVRLRFRRVVALRRSLLEMVMILLFDFLRGRRVYLALGTRIRLGRRFGVRTRKIFGRRLVVSLSGMRCRRSRVLGSVLASVVFVR